MTTYDVPGTITLADVLTGPANETWPQALHRLARKAVICGCMVTAVYGAETAVHVTSSRDPKIEYLVRTDHGTCTCAGFHRHRQCMHLALALAVTNQLPPVDAPPLRATYAGTCARTGRRFGWGTPITLAPEGWVIVDDEKLAA